MQLGKFELKMRHPRFWLGTVGTVVTVVVVYAIWSTFFVQSTNPPSHSPVQPSVAPQPLRPASYQHTRNLYGPWQLAAPNSTGAPRLVMLLASGGTDVSSKVVRVRNDWQKASALEIVAVVPSRRKVTIGTSDSNTFSLQYRQAFILAQRPDTVYGFLYVGPGKAQLVSTTVKALTKR